MDVLCFSFLFFMKVLEALIACCWKLGDGEQKNRALMSSTLRKGIFIDTGFLSCAVHLELRRCIRETLPTLARTHTTSNAE